MAATIHDFDGVVTRTAPTGGVTVGTVLDIGTEILLPLETAAAGASFRALCLNAVSGKRINGIKAKGGTGYAWTIGCRLYYDSTNDEFTTASTGNVLAAIAAAAKAAATTTGDIICIPSLGAF